MSAEATKARDAYLAWQAEIGTEDVMLAAPWTRGARAAQAAPSASGRASHREGAHAADTMPHDGAPTSSASHLPEVNFEPMKPFVVPGMAAMPGISGGGAGPEFFGAIAEKLAQDARSSARKDSAPRAARPVTPTPAVPAWLAALQAAKDLDAYWRLLEAEYPQWFPGAPAPLVRAAGHAAPRLAIVELMPVPGEAGTGPAPFAGANGALLDRMMTAIGLSREHLYLTTLMKSPPPPGKRWARKDTARMVPVLTRELQLAQCGLVLVMGEACAQAVLKTGRSIPALLKSPVEADGLSFSATWHPEEIRTGDAAVAATTGSAAGGKTARPRATQAWEHLQWVRGLLPRA